jgi:hypothetical protein
MKWKSVATALGRFMVFVANARQVREDGSRAPLRRRHGGGTRAGSNPRRPISPAA